MRVVAGELKKMWNIKVLAVIAALCVLYFISSMQSWLEHYPRGTWLFDVDIAHHLTENYGTTLERSYFDDFLAYEENIIREVTEFIQSRQVFVDAGIYCYEDYRAFRDEFGPRYFELDNEERSLWHAVTGEFGGIIRTIDGTDIQPNPHEPSMAYRKLFSFHNVVGIYHMNVLGDSEWGSVIDNFIAHSSLNERGLHRAIEIRDSGELLNIMPYLTIYHTWRYARSLAVFVILATLILVSPLVVTDKANRVNWLQYSSKQGRNILKKQFVAVLISSIGMTTILVLILAGIYGAATEVQVFWNNGINSFLNPQFYWLSITFGQYSLLMAGIIYLLSIMTAVVAFILSKFSLNRTRLLFKIVPLFVSVFMLSNLILDNFLAVVDGSVAHWLFELSVLGVLLFVGMVVAIVIMRRERRVEL